MLSTSASALTVAQPRWTPSAQPQRRAALPSRRVVVTRAQGGQEGVPGNPILSGQFLGVLQQSLARQGADALTKGIERSEEDRITAVEEVLQNALNQSKQTLRTMQQWRLQIDAQIVAQEKQVDRMEFALNKARTDAALMKTLKQMAYGNESD